MARTTLLAAGLLAGSLSTAAAVPAWNETVIHDTTTSVEIALNDDSVLCSSADYGALFLKILIPDLAKLTLLDHQNTGAGAPCVAAGSCQPGNMPSDIINSSHPTETVAIKVLAVRADQSDSDAQTCETFLIEKVNVTIRGVDFFHQREAPLGSRPFADCVTSTVVPEPEPVTPEPVDPDSKTDYGQVIEEPSGGCSATRSGSSGLILMLGALVALRRRRAA